MTNRPLFRGRPDYGIALLHLLCTLPAGQGKAAEVLLRFEEEYKDRIPQEDYQNYHAGDQKWKNTVRWCRNDLKELGFLDASSHGIWHVTDEGRRWSEENPSANRLPPCEGRKRPSHSRKDEHKPPTVSGSILTLQMLEETRKHMPLEKFRRVWGTLYDQLLAKDRAKPTTSVTQTELGRRTREQLDEIHSFLTGKTTSAPSSEKLCDWINFCYALRLYREATALLSYVHEDEVEPTVYKRAKRLAEVSRTKLG